MQVDTTEALRRALAAGESDVELAAGTYRAALEIGHSVELRAMPGVGADEAILEADRRGSVLFVQTDELEIRLTGLTLRGGSAEVGGGVCLTAFSTLVLRDCTLTGNRAREATGAAAFVDAGRLELRGCRLFDNDCDSGAELHADGVATLFLGEGCELRGEERGGVGLVCIRDGAEVAIEDCRLHATRGAAVAVSGTASRAPELRIARSRIIGRPSLRLRARFPGRTVVEESFLSSPAQGVYRPVGKVLVGTP